MNNGKYDTLEYKQKQAEKVDRLFGPVLQHEKVCSCCGKEFIFKGRIKTKEYERAKFCSRSCANNRQSWWKGQIENGTHTYKWSYRKIALEHHGHKCVVCGFDKVIDVHHLDNNRQNNTKENLVTLCPNHHYMIHRTKFANEVLEEIKKYLGVVG